ncbi:MAG: DNA polymerase III subunit delta [Legionellaceae bacterium]|nr:DNA polymerase III subunit delta [Legionellaceae bacterium]
MIKYPDVSFETHLKQPPAPVYLLVGQDAFLLNQAVLALKKNWRALKETEIEEKRIYLELAQDWHELTETANSYSLFYSQQCIDATWQKKSLDAKSKAHLVDYAKAPNAECLVILRAPLLPPKQCADLSKNSNIVCINIQTLNAGAELRWIQQQLKKNQLTYTEAVPELIQTYTRGNLHAASQTIERLALTYEPNTTLTIEMTKAQLVDERQYKLYEISSACLEGNAKQALDLTERARKDQVEPILILWFITQELRLLEQLMAGRTYQALKIYSFRTQQYQRALKRLSRDTIYRLIQQSQILDTHIKSGNTKQTWQLTERLIVDFAQ